MLLLLFLCTPSIPDELLYLASFFPYYFFWCYNFFSLYQVYFFRSLTPSSVVRWMNESIFLLSPSLKQYRYVNIMAATILGPSIRMLLYISMRDATASSNNNFCKQFNNFRRRFNSWYIQNIFLLPYGAINNVTDVLCILLIISIR